MQKESEIIKELWKNSRRVWSGPRLIMSCADIEKAAGMSKGTFSRIKSGAIKASVGDLLAISYFFGVQPQVIRPSFPWLVYPARAGLIFSGPDFGIFLRNEDVAPGKIKKAIQFLEENFGGI